MKKYKIKIIKRYSFTLDGENKEEIKNQVDFIVTSSKILDLSCVRKNILVKIREIKSRKDNEDEKDN